MNPLWLFVIVPASAFAGSFLLAIFSLCKISKMTPYTEGEDDEQDN